MKKYKAVRMDEEIEKIAVEMAKERGLSFSAYVRFLIMEKNK